MLTTEVAFVSRWPLELAGLAVLSAVVAIVSPRLFLAGCTQQAARLGPRTPPPRPSTPAAPTEIEFEDPSPPAALAADHDVSAVDPSSHRPGHTGVRPSSIPEGAVHRQDARWTVDLHRLGSPRAALAGVRLLPLDPDAGSGHGYQLNGLDRLGLLESLGVRRGDVLVAVNGVELTNPDRALEAYAVARRSPALTFRFRRGTSTYELHLDVVGGATDEIVR